MLSPVVFGRKSDFSANVDSVPGNVDRVRVEDVNSGGVPHPGAYVVGLTYARSSVSVGLAGEVFDATNAVHWIPQYSRDVVDCCEFGAFGDGALTAAGAVVGATSNDQAIQAAIEFALQNGIPDVRLPHGVYKTDDTIHLGWGDDFATIRLYGAGRAAFGPSLPGTTILPTRVDRPAVNIQGGRRSSIFGIQIIGQNTEPEFVLALDNNWSCDPKHWLAATLTPTSANAPGGIQRYAPYCAIAVDAYGTMNGPATTETYPAVKYPARVSLPLTGPKVSSESTIAECAVSRFAVGIITQPAADANGDFTRIRDCSIESCIFGIAVCQPQSRNVEIRNLDYRYCHTVLSGTRFGKAGGEFGGPICNVSGGASYQLAEFSNLSFAGSLLFQNVYCEDQVRIGRFVGGAAVSCAVTFESCYFNLAEASDTIGGPGHRQFPSGFIEAGHQHTIILRGTTIIGSSFRLSNLIAQCPGKQGTPAVVIEGCSLLAGKGAGDDATKQAVNYSGGILLGAAQYNSSRKNLATFVGGNNLGMYFDPQSPPGSTAGARPFGKQLDFIGSERILLHHAAETFVDSNEQEWRMSTSLTRTLIDIDRIGARFVAASAVANGDIWTFTYSQALMTAQANRRYRIEVGDLLYNQDTGTILLVTAVAAPTGIGYPITCRQQNNMVWTKTHTFKRSRIPTPTGAGQPKLPGSTLLIKTGVVIPRTVYWGDFVAGSAWISHVHRGDGHGEDVGKSLEVTDPMLSPSFTDDAQPWCLPFGASLVQISAGTAAIPSAKVQMSVPASKTGRGPVFPLPIS